MNFLRRWFDSNPYETNTASSVSEDANTADLASSSTIIDVHEIPFDVSEAPAADATTKSDAANTTYSGLLARLSNFTSEVTHCLNRNNFSRLHEETPQDNANSENVPAASNRCFTLLARFAEVYNSHDRVDRICFMLVISAAIASPTGVGLVIAGHDTAGVLTSLGSVIVGIPPALNLFFTNVERATCQEQALSNSLQA